MLLAWPGFEPMNSRSEVHHANHYTIEASYKKGQIFHVEFYNVLHFWGVKIQNACLLMNGLYYKTYLYKFNIKAFK